MKIYEIIKKINKKNFIGLISITIVTLMLCSNFLQMHFSSDTYALIDLGYFRYPSEYFLHDGRIFSTLACYIGGLLHLPYPVYIIGMDFLGMIFLSISIYIFSETIIKILQPQNLFFEILIILASHLLILNQFSLEYLLFPESAVMCMGMLFLILAIQNMVESNKLKYLKIFICLLITGLCYQGELNIFPVLAVFIYFLKQIKENKKISDFLKDFFFEMLKIGIITISVLVITFLVVKICKSQLTGSGYYPGKPEFLVKIVNERTFWARFRVVKRFTNEIWNYSIHMLPVHSLNITIIATLVLLIIIRAKKQTYFYYLILVLLCFISCILPLFVFNVGVCGRINVPIMMIFGISVFFLIANTSFEEINYKSKIAISFTIACFLINGIFIVQNTSEHIAGNKVDHNTGATIKSLIENYEKEYNIKVTKLGYRYDFDPSQYSVGIKHMQSMTERKFACVWSVVYTMNYYCDRKFEEVEYVEPEKENYFSHGNLDYDEFLEEQTYFSGDTIYMVIY